MKIPFRILSILLIVTALGGCASLGQSGASDDASQAMTGSLAEGLRLARLLRDNGRMEGAASVYARLDQRGELQGPLLLEYATVAATVRPAPEALALFGRARQSLGGDPQALAAPVGAALCNGLGRARLAMGQRDSALKDFDCALALEPNNTVALNGKAVLLDAAGQHEQARQLWQQAQQIDPADYSVLNNLAVSWLGENRPAETVRLLSQLDIPKNLPGLKLNLALAYLLEDQPEQAQTILSSLVSIRQAERLMAQLGLIRDRIHAGEPTGEALLGASRQLLALQGDDE